METLLCPCTRSSSTSSVRFCFLSATLLPRRPRFYRHMEMCCIVWHDSWVSSCIFIYCYTPYMEYVFAQSILFSLVYTTPCVGWPQLSAETYACALGDVYTFGPTFRAENSQTTRHLAEFWMIEPEMAFADLTDDMDNAVSNFNYCEPCITMYSLQSWSRNSLPWPPNVISSKLLLQVQHVVDRSSNFCINQVIWLSSLRAFHVRSASLCADCRLGNVSYSN